ncbi:MAG: glutaredoxin domain-containing protein [Candidatus Kuenenbacteria bacterium]
MKIKIYSTPVCSYCHLLKDHLKKHNIEFEDIDVSKDQEAGQEMVSKSGQMGVPVSVILADDGKEEVIVGFDKAKINKLLNIKE